MSYSTSRVWLFSVLASVMVLAGCPEQGGGVEDGGGGVPDGGSGVCIADADCAAGEVCVAGTCEPGPCTSDADCPGGSCNLITGDCESADGGSGDGGVPICTPAQTRCALDGRQVIETCSADGFVWEETLCEGATPTCLDAACVVCAPGSTVCDVDVARTCLPDASGYTDVDCAATGGTCVNGVCQACTPDAVECLDATTLRVCNAVGTAWVQQACVNGICDSTLDPDACVITSCVPDTESCQNDQVVRCNASGDGFDLVEDCPAAGETCQGAVCVNRCDEAVSSSSYIGCEYWPTILSSADLETVFKNDFHVVLANPTPGTTAQIEVWEAGGATPVVTDTVAGGELKAINLPWNGLDATVFDGTNVWNSQSASGLIAYKLTSTVPVTAYQFNPLSSSRTGGGPKVYSYTNDASLLLPAHVLGDAANTPASTYVVMAVPHIELESAGGPGSQAFLANLPAIVSVVATAPGTTNVTFTSSAYTAAGGGLAELVPGEVVTLTMQQHEVIQIASRSGGTELEATNALTGYSHRVYPESDLTGSIIESDQPVAVFGGADCHFVPFDKQACDHLEQQLFPFEKWGSSYLATRSSYKNNAVGDVWRVLSAVDGTVVTFDPDTVSAPVTLAAGEVFETLTFADFRVSSQDLDHPIMVAQFFPGIEVIGRDPTKTANTGDPSMVLAIPTEQYKDEYSFTTPATFDEDHINVIRPAGLPVLLDGVPVSPPSGWQGIGASGWEVGRVPVTDGAHRIAAGGNVGLTVYGFDWSVSYGYPGGLDLQNIVIIRPGG